MRIKSRYLYIYLIFVLLPRPSSAVEFENVVLYHDTLDQCGCFQVRFDLSQSYSNPYDPDVIEIDGLIIQPDGDTLPIPCFYYQDFIVNPGSYETYTASGAPEWRMRYTPVESGTHYFVLKANDSTGTYLDIIRQFVVLGVSAPGFIRRDPLDTLYFQFEDNSTYIPVGHNVCWDDGSGIAFYDHYFGQMGNVGENWTRVWMTPFARLALEWDTSHWSGYYDGLGRYAQEVAFKIDSIVALAERENIYMQMCIHSFNELTTGSHSLWDENPYNSANGGMLDSPEEFFTDADAKKLSKKKYRYIVARWGYSTNILSWELWNEVDITDNYDDPSIAAWHQEMASYFDSIDVNEHLITTSSSRSGDTLYWQLSEMDYTQIHRYGSGIAEALPNRIRTMQQNFEKPVIVGEYGYYVEGPVDTIDSTGVQLHKGIWSSLMAESGGMLWWWDNFIEECDLYYHFQCLTSYIEGEQFRRRSFGTEPNISISGSPTDTIVSLFPGLGWAPSSQDSFVIESDGSASGMENLSSFIQGAWHPEMGRRAVFVLYATRSGQIGVDIRQISSGAAGLQIFCDGVLILEQALTEGDEDIYWASIPAGTEHIRVYNNGQDWFVAEQYIFTCLDVPITRVQGLTDDSGGYLWFYDMNHNTGTPGSGVISGASATVKGLSSGNYNVEFWNTYPPGGILEDTLITSSADSIVFSVPDFTYDIAAKIFQDGSGVQENKGNIFLGLKNRVVSGSCEISLFLNAKQDIELSVLDITGRKIDNIEKGILSPGIYGFNWDTEEFAGGIYFVVLKGKGKITQVQKFIVIR